MCTSFTIRDLIWLVVVLVLSAGWMIDRRNVASAASDKVVDLIGTLLAEIETHKELIAAYEKELAKERSL